VSFFVISKILLIKIVKINIIPRVNVEYPDINELYDILPVEKKLIRKDTTLPIINAL
jgi:hypothetical protein